MLTHLNGAERDRFIEDIKPQLATLKKYNYGKQIAAIEKVIFGLPTNPGALQSPYTSSTAVEPSKPLPLEIISGAPTPVLTMEQSSPQSSSLPSTNASTVDGPTDSKSLAEKGTSEVRIHAS